MVPKDLVLPDVLILADLLRPAWAEVSKAIPVWHPRGEGDDDDNAESDDSDSDTADAASDGSADTGDKDDDKPAAADHQNDPAYLKAQSRKHEREKKAALKREADLKKRLDEIDAANLSEQDRKIKEAREEARAEALTEAEKARRADKLELAVTRIAIGKGVMVGEGDKAKTVKFADPDDVQMWLERQIERGDIDSDDIYADGRVDEDTLTTALAGLAASKPGWLVGGAAPSNGKPAGDPDAGKGAAPKAAGTVEDHLRAIRRDRK